MTSELVSVDARTGLDQVAQLMARKGIRRVLVMEGDRVLGVITAATMLRRLKPESLVLRMGWHILLSS